MFVRTILFQVIFNSIQIKIGLFIGCFFFLGKPAYLFSSEDVDWVPSKNLGLLQQTQPMSTSMGIILFELYMKTIT